MRRRVLAARGSTLALLIAAALTAVPAAAVRPAAKRNAGTSVKSATKVVAVRSEREGSRQVIRVESDGRPGGTVEKRAGPPRLVVSLPGLRSAVPGGNVASGGPFVKRIAVKRAPQGGKDRGNDGVQVVLYLVSPAAWEIRRDATGLSIVLSGEASSAAPAKGAEAARAPPPAAVGPRISLAEAIRRTLAASTPLLLAREEHRARLGLLQEAAGQFDTSVTFAPAFQRGLSAILAKTMPASASAVLSSGLPADKIDTFSMDLALPIRFRDGIVVSPFLTTQAVQDSGGIAFPTRFQADAGLRLDWPLAKGGGSASAGAAERAARMEAEAALDLVAHTASESVLRTVLAYWNLAATQERLALLERSADQQGKIERISRALVEGDEIPRSELDRIRARVADAEASAAQARRDVVSARVDLARSMGTVVAELDDAPLASDPLPQVPAVAELEKAPAADLAAIAAGRRADLRAAEKRRQAADVLWNAARINLRPRVDLSLQVGYTGITEDVTLDATSATGFWKSVTGRWAGPNAALGIRFEVPSGNRIYRGQWVQAGAAREQADLAALDLARSIRSRTVELADSVHRSVAEVSARDVSSQENDRTVSAAFEQFRAGEMSLVDAIVTERSQTQAGLDLVLSRQLLASRVAQMRFETGSLVPYVVNGNHLTFGEAAPVGLSFAEKH